MAEVTLAELPIRCLCEFLGTFLLVFSVIFSKLTGHPIWSGLAIAAVHIVLLQSMGKMASGIFNPAMSVALGTVRVLGGPGLVCSQVLAMVVAQLLGAFTAALIATLSLGKELPVGDYMGYGLNALGICEFVYTCMICFVALNVMSPKRHEKEKLDFYAVAIGFAVLAGIYGGNMCGAVFNPAVALALDITSPSYGFNGDGTFLSLFHLSAAYVAALLYSQVRPQEFNKPRSEGGHFERGVSECVGSVLVVLTASLNFRKGTIVGPLSVAAAMTSMAFALEDISGGHFNPAITCAHARAGWSGRFSWYRHWLAQICGAGIASLLVQLTLLQQRSFGPKLPYDLTQALVSEGIFTFLLCLVSLSVTVSSRTKASQFFGLAIGSCMIAGGYAISSVSGGALNPVIGLGLALAGGGLPNALAYATIQIASAALAAATFKVLHGEAEVKRESEIDAREEL